MLKNSLLLLNFFHIASSRVGLDFIIGQIIFETDIVSGFVLNLVFVIQHGLEVGVFKLEAGIVLLPIHERTLVFDCVFFYLIMCKLLVYMCINCWCWCSCCIFFGGETWKIAELRRSSWHPPNEFFVEMLARKNGSVSLQHKSSAYLLVSSSWAATEWSAFWAEGAWQNRPLVKC